ncbi:MAG: HAD family acid phosphatase [Candidatus Nanopelagicales bacterium]
MDDVVLAGIDIDGVVADASHRLHHVERRPKDWPAFFAAADADPVLPQGAAVVAELAASGLTIVYVSGRPESLRSVTADWLSRHGLPEGLLYLRRPRDFRPAAQVKVQLYRRLQREYPVGLIVDDDTAVVDALRLAGFEVRLADWMPARDPLRQAQERDGRT